jgi:hypothetical protein
MSSYWCSRLVGQSLCLSFEIIIMKMDYAGYHHPDDHPQMTITPFASLKEL